MSRSTHGEAQSKQVRAEKDGNPLFNGYNEGTDIDMKQKRLKHT
jgi:hypothetical protein